MNAVTKKKLTVMLDADVYEGLRRKVGDRGIGVYLSTLARPSVVEDDVLAGYKAMAADTEREAEVHEWVEGVFDDSAGEDVWRF